MNLQSDKVDLIAVALLDVQHDMRPALADSRNPFYDSKYADLNAVWLAARQPLQDNGIAVIQGGDSLDEQPYLITTLLHKSGQFLRGALPLPMPIETVDFVNEKTKKTYHQEGGDFQALGSGITYLRRYLFSSMLGIITTDDDGEITKNREDSKRNKEPEPKAKKPTRAELTKAIDKGLEMVNPGDAQAVLAEWKEKMGVNEIKEGKIDQLILLREALVEAYRYQQNQEVN